MSRQSKGKASVLPPEDELTTARSKLTDILTHISLGDQVDEDVEDEEDYDNTDYSMSPPAKMSRKAKKPKKGQDAGRPVFELVFFDRTVDLAPFVMKSDTGEVALYPVCREWIRDGHYDDLSHLREGDQDVQESGDDKMDTGVNRLPDPKHMPEGHSSKRSSRIPVTVTKPYVHLEDMDDAMANENPLEPEELLSSNLARWRTVRNEWKKTSNENEKRYKHSCDVLTAMYEKSMQLQNMVEPKVEPLDSMML
ncbi:Protein lin-37 -like protein [Halotydeus destructor]|nr:Protein lin-37 -like protein [Halotydeus destructor]